jgi:hypothetical protein
MSRKEVESYLKARGIMFRQMCCLGQNRGVYDDLVKIGEEKPQWVCSGQIIYVGFQFTAKKQHAASSDKTDELDILKTVDIYRLQEGCL